MFGVAPVVVGGSTGYFLQFFLGLHLVSFFFY